MSEPKKHRPNRLANRERIPAGTRARWDWKLRILDWLSKLYPITHVCVEDIKARTIERAKKWNQSFSPLEVGKQWFYTEIRKRWQLLTLQGWETKEIRDRLGLKKSSNKLSETFEAHCVDSWCLAYHTVRGECVVDETGLMCISPIPIARRELHRQNPKKGGKRPRYGGTTCKGLVKNTLVKHVKHGLTRISGFSKETGISLYSLEGKRLCQNAKAADFRVLTRLNFNYRSGFPPPNECGVSNPKKEMSITQFTMEEVRCFGERQTLEIRPLTFLVGENSTGKTTALACFNVLANYLRREGVDFNTDPYSMGIFKDIVRNSRPKEKTFKLGFTIETVEWTVEFSEKTGGIEPVVNLVKLKFSDGEIVF